MGHRLRSLVRTTTIRVDSQGRCCNLQEFLCGIIKRRSGTRWMQTHWQVTVEGKASVKKLAGVFPFTERDSARRWSYVADSTEVYKTTKESASVEQGQLLRAAEPDQCFFFKVKTQRQSDTVEFTHSLLCVFGKAADDLHRRRQDSELEPMLPLRPEWTKFW